MMRRAAFVLWAAVALSPAVSGQIPVLTPGVAAQGHIEPQTRAAFGFYANPGDAVLVRLLSLSQDYSLRLTVSWNLNFPTVGASQPITPRSYSVPSSTPGNPPSVTLGPGGAGVIFGAEYDLPGGSQGFYTITVGSANGVAGDFLLVYTSLKGNCPSSNPSCAVVPLNCGVPALNQQIGSPHPVTTPPQPASPWLQLNTYQFQANPGDTLSVRAAKYASQTMPLASGFNLTMIAYDSSGKILYTNPATVQFAGVQTGGYSGATAKMDFPAPAGGLVNVIVFDASNQTGNFGITVTTLNRPCSNKSLTCGSASQGTLATPLAFDSYKASLSGGATISIRASATATGSSLAPVIEVYDPTGSPVKAAQSVTTAVFNTTTQGDYTVLVESATYLQTGGYAVAFARLDVPCSSGGVPPQVLSCASVVDGSINGTLQANSYSVAAQANDAFLIRLEQTSPNSAFRPRVDVYDPLGNPVTFTNTNLQPLPFTVTANGSYTLTVTDSSAAGGQTGTYSLSLLRLNRPCNAGTLGCGALAAGSFSRPLASSVYTYAAAAGESFTLRMLDYTGALLPDLRVYDPLGNPVGQSTSGNVTGVDVAQPAAGVYTVVAMDASALQAGGPFGVELLRTKNACSAAAPQGQTVNGVINGAQAFMSYSIPATNGDALMVRSASLTPGFAAQMDLYDPSGAHLPSSTFEILQPVSTTGTYTVIVSGSAPLTTGGYALSWQLLNKPAATSALQCGGSTTASLSATNQFRYYLAGASAGDLLRLIFTRISANFSPQIELFDPSGTRITGVSNISQKAKSGGAYLVVVSPSTTASQTGSFTVAFQRPNNPCSPTTTITCGQPTLRQVAIPGQLDTYVFAGTRGGQADIKLASRSDSYFPYAELYDASGNQLTTASNGQLTYVILTTGNYTMLVRDLSGVSLGSYRASFQDDYNPCSITDTEPPVVTLLKPTGGEVITGNTSYLIQWQSDDNVGVVSHNVALSTDGGQTFATTIASGLAGNTQIFNWFVPPTIAPSRTAVIQVTATDGAGNAQSALSGPLSLIGSGFTPNSTPSFTFDSLNRLTQAVLGDGRTIVYTWDAAGNVVAITVSGQ